jgi:hypothetical protein
MSRNYEVSVRLTANDIGTTGSHNAGIYVPKDPRILSLLPNLDKTERNPDAWFKAYFPELGKIFDLRYIYYNNQFWSNGTRNEYRITWIREALAALHAQENDQLVFSKSQESGFVVTIELRKGSIDQQIADAKTSQVNERWSVTILDG